MPGVGAFYYSASGGIGVVDAPPVPAPSGLRGPGLRLHIRFASDGTPTVQGIVRPRSGFQPPILVAERDGAQASCGDQGGNREPGLTSLAFLARNPGARERVPVSLTTAETEDIDHDGRYVVALRIGDSEERVEVAVRAFPPRRRRRQRR